MSALLGISITSAVQWTHRAKRGWHQFIQARATTDSGLADAAPEDRGGVLPAQHGDLGRHD